MAFYLKLKGKLVKKIFVKILSIIDFLLFFFVYPAAFLLKCIRIAGVHNLPFCKKALLHVGVFPIRNHYAEPLFDFRHERLSARDRSLPGIGWNVEEQLKILKKFNYNQELNDIPNTKIDDLTFSFGNGAFESGDAEYWFNLIRLKKPTKIFEAGSGYSTLIAIKAIEMNKMENPGYACKHVCIEPYYMPWLERTGVVVLRNRIEEFEKKFFSELVENDILFIDSSHIIRPKGDVLFEYLELLPALNSGVVVHLHDIFSPNDYPDTWIKNQVKFWNEQYILEAFLSSNQNWKIIGALNFLHHNHYDQLKSKCPYLTFDREPGSFYIQKL
jgi:hypothetical protein